MTLRIAGGQPVLGTHSLIATLRPQMRRQFAKRGLGIPAYIFLPDGLVMVVERQEADADLASALDSFLRDSHGWMMTLGCPATWDPDVRLAPVEEGRINDEVRRILELSRVRNLSNDPYDYPYMGSVGIPVWQRLGDPMPERLPGL